MSLADAPSLSLSTLSSECTDKGQEPHVNAHSLNIVKSCKLAQILNTRFSQMSEQCSAEELTGMFS